MKKMMIMGMTALAVMMSMSGCGADEASGSGAASAQADSPNVPAAPDTSAARSADSNEFLSNLNKQMENFEDNIGKVTVETADQPSEKTDTTTAAEPVPPTEPDSSDDLDTNELLASLGERQRAGSAEYGFIDVPINWQELPKEEGAVQDMLQYANGVGSQIITMTRYQYMVAQQVADHAYDGLLADPAAEILGSRRCEIEGRSAYRIDVKYKDDLQQDMTIWTVQGDDSYTYYLAIEYTDPAVFELARTYSIEK